MAKLYYYDYSKQKHIALYSSKLHRNKPCHWVHSVASRSVRVVRAGVFFLSCRRERVVRYKAQRIKKAMFINMRAHRVLAWSCATLNTFVLSSSVTALSWLASLLFKWLNCYNLGNKTTSLCRQVSQAGTKTVAADGNGQNFFSRGWECDLKMVQCTPPVVS